MRTIGKFKIRDSFRITGRGLVVIGDLIEGKVNVGSIVTFTTETESVTLKIGGVEMADNRPRKNILLVLHLFIRTERCVRSMNC